MAEEDYPIPVIDGMRIHPSQNHYVGATSGREIPPSNTSRQQEMQQGDLPAQSGYNPKKNLNCLRTYRQENLSQHDVSGKSNFKYDRHWMPKNSQQESPTPEDFRARNGFIDAKTGRKNRLRRMTQEEIEMMESQDKEDVVRNEEAAISRVKEQTDLRETKEKRRIRDEEEMYQGLKNFKGNQRGWNGEREPDRRATIQRYHEQEDLKLKEQEKAKRRRASTSAESKSSKGKATEDTQSQGHPNKDEQPEHISKEELAASMMAVWNRRAIEEMDFDDYVQEEAEKTRAFLRSRKWDVDAIKADAIADAKALREGKVRSKPQSKRGKRRSSGMTRESIPSPPNTQQEQHRENFPVNSDSSPLTGPPDAQRQSSTIRRQSSTAKRRSRETRPTEAERLAGDGILGVWSSPPISEHRQSQKEEFSLLNRQPTTEDDQPSTTQQDDTSSPINHQPSTADHQPSPAKRKSVGPRPTEAERLAGDGILGVWSSPPTSERRQSKKAPSFTTTNDSQPSTTDRQPPTPRRRSGGPRPTEAERLAGDGILGMGSSPPVMPRLSQKPKYYGQGDGDDES